MGNIANHNYVHSDEHGSLDSTETKPKHAKLLAENQLNSTLPDIQTTFDGEEHISNAHSTRSKSQDPVLNNTPKTNNKNNASRPSSDSEKGILIKSKSFPQHSAPPKKSKHFALHLLNFYAPLLW